MSSEIFRSKTIDSLVKSLKDKKKCSLSGLWDSSKEYVISRLAEIRKVPFLVVVENRQQLETCEENLGFYSSREILRFPAWETLPHDRIPPHRDIVAERFACLSKLNNISTLSPPIIVTEIRALVQKILSPNDFNRNSLCIKKGENLGLDVLAAFLVSHGYSGTDMVEMPGEWSRRGGILDFFPISGDNPVRVEFFGDEIDSLRIFDRVSQTSLEHIQETCIYPAGELDFYDNAETKLDSLLAYLPEKITIVFNEWDALKTKYSELHEQTPSGSPLFVRLDEIFTNNLSHQTLFVSELQNVMLDNVDEIFFPQIKRISSLFTGKNAFTNTAPQLAMQTVSQKVEEGYSVHIVVNNTGEKDRLNEYLKEYKLLSNKRLVLEIGKLANGFFLSGEKVMIVTDHELFRRYKVRYRRKKLHESAPIKVFSDIKKGDCVVHLVHGIGIFEGTLILEEDDKQGEYLSISYQDDAKLYVPVDNIGLVQKYIGIKDHAPKIDKLGGSSWKKKKEKVERSVRDLAAELLQIQAKREIVTRKPYPADSLWQKEFEDAFIYPETPDQVIAIHDVKKDMESKRPMDRLICGDVGYGKTEVAVRAAFKAALDGRQTAVLVPTTILAQQHFNTFSDRMADYPVTIAMLSRFKRVSEQKEIIEKVKSGGIDILIGTHRLLQKDVSFKNLGLVIIDEEQRFGVHAKETLKKMKELVDVITLSATPIPRTLYLALMQSRDMSVINTPPEDRLPIETILAPYSEKLIKDAIKREIARNGQVYFVHNRVMTIKLVAKRLSELFPELAIAFAHGQMPEEQLSKVMDQFMTGTVQILVCTTIIESGLDIPNVNTILVDQAEKFGLADLYQLRGRVGRFNRRAYAYLLFSRGKQLLPDAKKRLKTIEDFTELGSGFKIAMRDLEIRGAGNVLGKEQHGHIIVVGFELYLRLLGNAIKRLKGESLEEETDVEINCGIVPMIPKDYIFSEKLRLQIYAKSMSLANTESLSDLKKEIIDRFGPIPRKMENVFDYAQIRLITREKGLTGLDVTNKRIFLKKKETIVSVTNLSKEIHDTTVAEYLEEIKNILLHYG